MDNAEKVRKTIANYRAAETALRVAVDAVPRTRKVYENASTELARVLNAVYGDKPHVLCDGIEYRVNDRNELSTATSDIRVLSSEKTEE